MSDMLERVIQAILREAREKGADSPVDFGDAEQLARAGIDAMSDPDMAMISAAVAASEKSGLGDFAAIWRAMITAALGKD